MLQQYYGGESICSPPRVPHCGGDRPPRPRGSDALDSMSESILDELEAIDLGLVEIVVERDNYSSQIYNRLWKWQW
jgi:hypothetical protein